MTFHGSVAVIATVWTCFVFNALLLVVSVTEWCKHGAFLPSSIMIAYFTLNCWLVAAHAPAAMLGPGDSGASDSNKTMLLIIGGIVVLLCLFIYVRNPDLLSLASGEKQGSSEAQLDFTAAGADGEGGSSSARDVESGEERDTLPPVDIQEAVSFILTHMCCLLYFFVLISLTQSAWAFWILVAGLIVGEGLYAYSLIAPQFVGERDFY